MLIGSKLSDHFELLRDYCSQIEPRSEQTLYFDVQPFSRIAQHTFERLTTGGYIEHIGSTTWRLTQYGAYRLVRAQNDVRREWHIGNMLFGFLVGLFNGECLNDKSHKFIHPSWQTILYPCIRELRDESIEITNGHPSLAHNKDFYHIVKSIAQITGLTVLKQGENDNSTISFQLRDNTGELSIFFATFGVIIGSMI